MRLVAIIGTREPTGYQQDIIRGIIDRLDPAKDSVISGCAYGVDAYALKYAQKKGIETIGVLPWPKYNPDVQAYCTKVATIEGIGAQHSNDAFDSVNKFHPNPKALSLGARKLHARNYGIVRWASEVHALPGNKPGGGGTGQGIRLAKAYGITLHEYGTHEQLDLPL